MGSLFDDVRSEVNIFSAWRHVKRSALNSENPEIRGFASEFEQHHQRHLNRTIRQLREGRFEFDPAKGVLKDKKKRLAAGKDPRPIVIATLKNRIVQRAILQVLQPRKVRNPKDVDSRFEVVGDPRLGRINDVNRSKFGVGGLIYPYGGVRPAIGMVLDAMDQGARHYYQSDIKAFFTKIPTATVVDWIATETSDKPLAELFAKGLEVHLENSEELAGYAKLFPSGGIGVAQGSSLSAFAGNVLLYELDHELNSMDVTAVRYIDDIMMVASNESELDKAIERASRRLKGFGFSLYQPVKGSTKAARGLCADGFNFLGCTIQPKRCVPSGPSIKRIKSDVMGALSSSKAAIIESIRSGKHLDPKKTRSATLQSIGRKLYGWQKAFAFATDTGPFSQLDQYVAQQVADYDAVISRHLASADPKARLRAISIPLTADMHDESKLGTPK